MYLSKINLKKKDLYEVCPVFSRNELITCPLKLPRHFSFQGHSQSSIEQYLNPCQWTLSINQRTIFYPQCQSQNQKNNLENQVSHNKHNENLFSIKQSQEQGEVGVWDEDEVHINCTITEKIDSVERGLLKVS